MSPLLCKDVADLAEYDSHLLQNLAVREAQDAQASGLEPGSSIRVLKRLTFVKVVPAVYLNCQVMFVAIEVEDVGSECLLSPELCSEKGAIAQAMPELGLGLGLRVSELTV